MTLELTKEEIEAIFAILGDMPSKAGVFPLMMKIKAQYEENINGQSCSADA